MNSYKIKYDETNLTKIESKNFMFMSTFQPRVIWTPKLKFLFWCFSCMKKIDENSKIHFTPIDDDTIVSTK